MKNKILQLRAEGKTYNQIIAIIGCSKGTVSYHCGKGQKDKTKIRTQIIKTGLKYKLSRKIDGFLGRTGDHLQYVKRDDVNQVFYDKLIKNPICYLTGKYIDLNQPHTYSLDHIIPYCISQDNSIENAGLACREANLSKSSLSLDTYISLCREVLEYNGYMVIKNI